MHMNCEFEDTGLLYNSRRVYVCKVCGMQLAMDDPNKTKVLCFKKQQLFHNLVTGEDDKNHILPENTEKESVRRVLEQQKNTTARKDSKENLCSQEQINNRLDICKKCPYYQNNTCLMCGCTVVRDANYQNKLAKKDQSCPINKWGPIE
jgi:hypothetical protein